MCISKSETIQISRRGFGLGLAAFGLVACGNVTSANQRVGAGAGAVTRAGLPADLRPTPNAGYDKWVEGFYTRAQAQGITEATLRAGFRNAGYLPGW